MEDGGWRIEDRQDGRDQAVPAGSRSCEWARPSPGPAPASSAPAGPGSASGQDGKVLADFSMGAFTHLHIDGDPGEPGVEPFQPEDDGHKRHKRDTRDCLGPGDHGPTELPYRHGLASPGLDVDLLKSGKLIPAGLRRVLGESQAVVVYILSLAGRDQCILGLTSSLMAVEPNS